MTTTTHWFARLADAVTGFNEESMGDERESLVLMRGYTFAFVVSTVGLMVAALALALWGYWVIAACTLVYSGLQSYAVIAYAAVHKVPLYTLNERTSRQRKRVVAAIYGVLLIGIIGARMYQSFVGHPVFGSYGATKAEPELSTIVGLVSGLVTGVVAVGMVQFVQKKRLRALELASEELEE